MPVKLASGLVVICATNDTALLGWMAADAEAGAEALVYIAEPSLLVKLVFDGTYAATSVGISAEVTVGSTTAIINDDEVTNHFMNMVKLVDATAKTAWYSHVIGACQMFSANS
jgi:hypothetical protein